MIADVNQIYPYNKILGGPKLDDDLNHVKSTWILLRSAIRKNKINKIYGENSDRKEKF